LRRVGELLNGDAFRGTLLLGHLHWDHTQGLPFFSAGDREDARVHLMMPAQGDPERLLERMISPPFFPIAPHELRGQWEFTALDPGDYDMERFDVVAREIPHKGGRAFGFRISDGKSTIAYMSDHSPIAIGAGEAGFGEYHEAARALASGVDVLIHDGQHTGEEFGARAFLGHSAVEYAIGLARGCGARKVVLFHHDPSRTDDEIDAIVASHRRDGVDVEAAVEGTTITLSP
jgi:phosphoribosyl 1,2-cyclic phosphodiesterase